MSANRNSVKKSYCKVCHDAGKPESVYTSHCVKTYNINTGKTDTTCPTLLALECRYCYKNGHTVKFCPVLEGNKKNEVERARYIARLQYDMKQQQQAPQQAAASVQRPKNAFASLADDSDDEQETQTQVQAPIQVQAPKDEFPALNGFSRVAQTSAVKSYSCVAATPADEKRLEASRNEQKRRDEAAAISTQQLGFWVEDSDDEEEEEVYTSVYVPPTTTMDYISRMNTYDDDDCNW